MDDDDDAKERHERALESDGPDLTADPESIPLPRRALCTACWGEGWIGGTAVGAPDAHPCTNCGATGFVEPRHQSDPGALVMVDAMYATDPYGPGPALRATREARQQVRHAISALVGATGDLEAARARDSRLDVYEMVADALARMEEQLEAELAAPDDADQGPAGDERSRSDHRARSRLP